MSCSPHLSLDHRHNRPWQLASITVIIIIIIIIIYLPRVSSSSNEYYSPKSITPVSP